MRTHKQYLREQLRDSDFARDFRRERQKLRIAYDIHSARIDSGLSQKELAEKAGVTQQKVSRVENAVEANMTQATVCKIASALGMDVGLVPR